MFELNVTDRGVVLRYRGAVTYDGIAEAAQAMAEHADFRPNLPTVWDFSMVESPSVLGADDMRRLASALAPLREGGGQPRVAIVTPHDANFAGARMFGGLNEARLLIDLGIFRNVSEAMKWAFDPRSDDDVPDVGRAP